MVHDPNRNNRTARGDSSLRGSTFFPFTFETLRPSGIVTNPTLGERAPLLCTKSTERTASILAPCLSLDFPPFTHRSYSFYSLSILFYLPFDSIFPRFLFLVFYTPASRRKHFAIFHQEFLHEERRNLRKLRKMTTTSFVLITVE